jgi:hypothetical protein
MIKVTFEPRTKQEDRDASVKSALALCKEPELLETGYSKGMLLKPLDGIDEDAVLQVLREDVKQFNPRPLMEVSKVSDNEAQR